MKSYNQPRNGGDTGRLAGTRVRKSHPLVVANGEVDELSAHLGLCLAAVTGPTGAVADALASIQADLLSVGAMIAGHAPRDRDIGNENIEQLEREIARADEQLDPLDRLILPGGCELACRLHVARCVCRRAERAVVAAVDAGHDVAPPAIAYLNRLSDLLFALARLANQASGIQERPWNP